MYYPMYYYMDPTYLLVLAGVVICMLASLKMKSTFRKYSHVRNHSGITGREAAEQILRRAGIYDVRVEPVPGNLLCTAPYSGKPGADREFWKYDRMAADPYRALFQYGFIGVVPESGDTRFFVSGSFPDHHASRRVQRFEACSPYPWRQRNAL